jgi:hypothetical protein
MPVIPSEATACPDASVSERRDLQFLPFRVKIVRQARDLAGLAAGPTEASWTDYST